jgi:integrase
MELNQSTVNKLIKDKVPASGSVIIWDSRISGFGLRLTANGVASFILNYRNADGVERRWTIGRCKEWPAKAAYDEAIERKKAIREGADPLATRDAEEIAAEHKERTLVDVSKEYLENHAKPNKRESSYRNDKAMLENIILPRLGSIPLSEIRTKDVEGLKNFLQAHPYQANRVLALLSTIFNRVIAQDAEDAEDYHGEEPVKWITVNPARMKGKRLPGGVERYKERKRKKFLSIEQLDAMNEAIDRYSSKDVANIVRLQLLTGSRAKEVLEAEWKEFDLKLGIWTKPQERTKQDEEERLELGSRTIELLKQIPRNGSRYLFPSEVPERKKADEPRSYIKWAWMAICRDAEITYREKHPGEQLGLAEERRVKGKGKYAAKEFIHWKPLYRVHDLRHTFASHLVSNGESLETIGKLVGHKNERTTKRYAHLADTTQKKAADHFAEIIGW